MRELNRDDRLVIRTMPGDQVLAMLDQMTEQGMEEFARLRSERAVTGLSLRPDAGKRLTSPRQLTAEEATMTATDATVVSQNPAYCFARLRISASI